MKRGYSALDIANWFLWYNEMQQTQNSTDEYDVYEGLTHLKVQKLLYYAEGVNLAVNDEPLFKEKIYAWPHGPVVKEVYNTFSSYGKTEIEFDDKNYSQVEKINNDSEAYNVLVTVYNAYAGYTAWQLREKSHVPGGPWQVTVDTKGMQKEIDKRMIKNYFKENIVK